MPGHGDSIERRPCILHISADYPDAIAPSKTPVIDRLIGLIEDRYSHHVISLNRRSLTIGAAAMMLAGSDGPVDEASIRPCDRGICLKYLAPARGVLHLTMLKRLADWIVGRLRREGPIPDLVIGHKLTVEGLMAREVAAQLGIPYALVVQGNTDQKILAFRPDLAPRFAETFHGAACVFAFAPWARNVVEQKLGTRTGVTLDLPCPTADDTIRAPSAGGKSLLSVFHLRNHRVKNLEGLAKAVQIIEASGQSCPVEIVGGGEARDVARCLALAETTAGMTLVGERRQDELGVMMNAAVALVMPSRRESFGLVFLEALFAGLPVIYPKGASVDGYFDDLAFAIGVDARDPKAIADAMNTMIAQETAIKTALGDWQRSGGLEGFTRSAIAARFAEGLDIALATKFPDPSATTPSASPRNPA